jgi:phospholipid N-methyltransferase
VPNEHRLFFREFLNNFHTTGAIAPSSRWLARALTHYVAQHPEPGRSRRILEVGPGTGAVTQYLVPQLAPHDMLTLVELNDRFVEHLRKRFDAEPVLREAAPRTDIVHNRLERLDASHRYDVIVSGLPLNNFSVDQVRQILDTFRQLLAPDGTLSFFEYMAIRPARSLIGRREDRKRLRGIGRALAELFAAGEARRQWVWTNLPPAWVHHVGGFGQNGV